MTGKTAFRPPIISIAIHCEPHHFDAAARAVNYAMGPPMKGEAETVSEGHPPERVSFLVRRIMDADMIAVIQTGFHDMTPRGKDVPP